MNRIFEGLKEAIPHFPSNRIRPVMPWGLRLENAKGAENLIVKNSPPGQYGK
jgi:hypothetical protein